MSTSPDTGKGRPIRLDHKREQDTLSKIFEGSPHFKSEVCDGMYKAYTASAPDSMYFPNKDFRD